jgi:hypothetical protein
MQVKIKQRETILSHCLTNSLLPGFVMPGLQSLTFFKTAPGLKAFVCARRLQPFVCEPELIVRKNLGVQLKDLLWFDRVSSFALRDDELLEILEVERAGSGRPTWLPELPLSCTPGKVNGFLSALGEVIELLSVAARPIGGPMTLALPAWLLSSP